jgi:GNAT superfamily N-acetyltransferase
VSDTGTYKISQIGISDFDVLIPLMKDCFGLDVNTDLFNWKYKQNPSGEFVGFIATSEAGEVGAYYGVIPETYMVEGKQKLIYQSCDTMTHSAHRRKGLFQLLANHCYDYLRQQDKFFIIGFGGAMSLPGFIKFGWKEVTAVQQVFYPRLLAGLRLPIENRGYTVEKVTDVSLLGSLLEKSNSHTAIHSLKNVNIFSWRLNNPLHDYRLYAAKDSKGNIDGYICYYISRNKIYLFDFFFTEKAAEKILLDHVKKVLAHKKLKGIQVLCSSNSYLYKVLSRNSFISSPFKKWPERLSQSIIFFSTEEQMKKYDDPSFWNFTPFDHDML